MAADKKNKTVDKAQENRDLLSDELISLRFLAKVSKIMEQKSMTKKELASKLNTSPSYVTQLFQGDKLINVRLLTKIKRALNVTIEVTCNPVLLKPDSTSQQLALNTPVSTVGLSIGISSNLDDFSILEQNDVNIGEGDALFQITLTADNGVWIYKPESTI